MYVYISLYIYSSFICILAINTFLKIKSKNRLRDKILDYKTQNAINIITLVINKPPFEQHPMYCEN